VEFEFVDNVTSTKLRSAKSVVSLWYDTCVYISLNHLSLRNDP
jgi:hypothetical protein